MHLTPNFRHVTAPIDVWITDEKILMRVTIFNKWTITSRWKCQVAVMDYAFVVISIKNRLNNLQLKHNADILS